MKSRYLKAGLASIGLAGGAIFGLMVYDMSTMPMLHLVMCSSDEGGIRIPARLCEYYMKNHRGNDEDMQELAVGGLDVILNGESKKKYDIAAFFIAKGLDVNGVNHHFFRKPNDYTPLHASVLYNDAERAKFLIDHGADLDIKSKSANNMTALEFAKALQKERPTEDRRELIRLLSRPRPQAAPNQPIDSQIAAQWH